MSADNEFIERLSVLGLSEKEAQLYHYLLKYGSKTPSMAAKYLKTYREDVHRTLSALVDKGLVTTSLDKPTLYTAVPIDRTLEAMRQQRLYEQQKIQETEDALLALSNDFVFDVPSDVQNFKVLKNLLEIFAISRQTILRAEHDLFFIPPDALGTGEPYGIIDAYKEAKRRGVNIRAVSDIAPYGLSVARELVADGIHLRHCPGYQGLRFLVIDGRESLTSISIDKPHARRESVAVLWCDSPVYAQYLQSLFEIAWKQSIDPSERIAELSRASQ
ncbi:MAG: TrmB family transcriptional regulator [Halobacteriota archaeon]